MPWGMHGWSPRGIYGSHHVCVLVSESFREKAVCIFSAITEIIRTEKFMQAYCLGIDLWCMYFRLEALLSNYGMICSPSSTAVASELESNKERSHTIGPGFLSAWQFNLYNKSNGDLREIQYTVSNWAPMHHCQIFTYHFLLFFVYTNSCLAALLLYPACLQLQTFTLWYPSIYRPAIMLLV